MPDFTFNIFRITDIGGTDGLESAGSITVRDDNSFRDDIFDDIEQAGPGETNGDQEVIASGVTELDVGDTIRTRGIFRFTNNVTGETYDVTEVFSQTAGNPIEQLFIFTSTAPDWLFDNTSRSFALFDSDGTLPYSSIVCFSAGTSIRMADGSEVMIEHLKPGDLVLTEQGEAHPIRWIGSQRVTADGFSARPNLRPIRIKAGALGCGLPLRDLFVSPQHRILVKSVIASRMFATNDVLIPAVKLLALDGIDVADDLDEVEYFHILFDQHQVIFSNGAPTESLFTGPEAIKAIPQDARTEIALLFPEILSPDFMPMPARLIPEKGKDIKQLVARHHKNNKPLLADINS